MSSMKFVRFFFLIKPSLKTSSPVLNRQIGYKLIIIKFVSAFSPDLYRSSLLGTCYSKCAQPQGLQTTAVHIHRTQDEHRAGSHSRSLSSFPGRKSESWGQEHPDKTLTWGRVCFYNSGNTSRVAAPLLSLETKN